MRRCRRLAPLVLLWASACSSLDEGEAGVVALELRIPFPQIIEVNEALQLGAVPLDADGDSVAATVTWRTPDNTISVGEATGIVTGVSPGTGRVQATAGSLSSEFVSFTVLAPADTIIIEGDSVVIAPADPGVTPPLVVRLESFNPPGALGSRNVIYEITRPVTEPFAATLPGGVLLDTVQTDADGRVTATAVSRVPGAPVPDTVIVEVRASRTRGAPVPGSGQRFIVLYQ